MARPRLPTRNLYLVKTSLETFGEIPLPSNCDVLRRCLNFRNIQNWGSKDACEFATNELLWVGMFSKVPLIPKPDIHDKMRNLLYHYDKLAKDAQVVHSLTAEQLDERDVFVLGFLSEEKGFCKRLNSPFVCWPSNAVHIMRNQLNLPEPFIDAFKKDQKKRHERFVDYDLETDNNTLLERLKERALTRVRF